MKKLIAKIVILGLATATSHIAIAQTAVAQQEAEQDSGGIQDIVVTARRSSESMQSVPVAITALSGQFLERQNMTDATALPLIAPNLTILQQTSSMSAASVYIRGIGNQEPSAVSEQGVGMYLNGVYLARSAGAVFDMIDLERVEVLRGPQGTLFGRNTIGGAIQFVTKKPSEDLHLTAKAGIGRYNDWYLRGRVDTGRIGNSPFRISIAGQHRESDGFLDNRYAPASQDPGAIRANSVAVGVEADFGPLTASYAFDWDERTGTPSFFQMYAATPQVAGYFAQSPNFGGDPFVMGTTANNDVLQAPFPDGSGAMRFTSTSRVQGHGLTLAYEASPDITLKSITGYRKFFQDTITNLSGSGYLRGQVVDFNSPTLVSVQPVITYNGSNAPQTQRQWSEELQLLGKTGDFNFLVGGYFFHEKSGETNRQAITLVSRVADLVYLGFPQSAVGAIQALNPGLSVVGVNAFPLQAFNGTARSVAAFGQVSWKPASLDERLELTVGGRYTSDKKTLTLAGDVVPNQSAAVKYDNFSWLASASYKIVSDVMVYARVSTGYRSGGINPRAGIINIFAPEKATAYEAGIKSDLLNKRLRLNLSGYLTEYSNLQVQQFAAGSGGATSLIVNAGEVQLSGFEAEIIAIPVDGLTLDGSVGYVRTKYKTFSFLDPFTNVVSNVADIARPLNTPTWSARIGGEYVVPLGEATAVLRVDYSYRTKMYFNALNLTAPFNELIYARPDNNLKARLSVEEIQLGGGKLNLGVWGDNLTNGRQVVNAIDFGGLGFAGAVFKKPTTWGIDAKVSF